MAERCAVFHDEFGSCELPYRHDGPHSRVPGGSTMANTWRVGTCTNPAHTDHGCWVVLTHEGPVRAIVFDTEGAAYRYAFENHAASVAFQGWGEES